jgi:hypothetical protein
LENVFLQASQTSALLGGGLVDFGEDESGPGLDDGGDSVFPLEGKAFVNWPVSSWNVSIR